MRISVVIPFYNEEGNVRPVLDEARRALPNAEIIAVNDGSTDGTKAALDTVKNVRVISLTENSGQGVAIYEGCIAATGDIIATMDGDGQNDPADIPRLCSLLEEADCVWGYRAQRADTIARKIAGKVANGIRAAALGLDGVRDAGTMRAFRREHVVHLVRFEGLHRFMPTLFAAAGLTIVETPISHRKRHKGASKYTITGRAFRGARDLFRIKKLTKRT